MDKGMKIYHFDRNDKLTFEDFKTKVLAIGAIMGSFDEALTTDLDISTTFTATHMQTIQEENLKKCTMAWNYLQLALTQAPLMYVQRVTSGNPYNAWRQLREHYKPITIDAFSQVMQEMQACVLED